MPDKDVRRRPRNWPGFGGDEASRSIIALSRLEDMTRLVSEWVWETDVEGGLSFVSERALEVLGLHPVQMCGKTFANLGRFIDGADGVGEPDWRHPFRDKVFEMPDSAGRTKRFLISGIPVFNKKTWEFLGAYGVSEDVTARDAMIRELGEAREIAEAANKAKSEFLTSMSHELRTPLNSILGFGQVLEMDENTPLTEMQARAVRRIIQGGDHLLNLINDILDLSRIEAGRPDLEIVTFPPHNEIHECLSLVTNLAEDQGVVIEDRTAGKNLPLLRADALRFRQVLLNLLSNAIKYNRQGGSVTVDHQETNDAMVRFSVTDTGAGMSKKNMETLFVAFNRLGRESSSIEGTGIGLTISRGLVHAMGGRIGVESEVGEGSRFWIDLPAATAATDD